MMTTFEKLHEFAPTKLPVDIELGQAKESIEKLKKFVRLNIKGIIPQF